MGKDHPDLGDGRSRGAGLATKTETEIPKSFAHLSQEWRTGQDHPDLGDGRSRGAGLAPKRFLFREKLCSVFSSVNPRKF